MSRRQRSGTYSSLCESEVDFVLPARSFSIGDLRDLEGIELDSALMKDLRHPAEEVVQVVSLYSRRSTLIL